MLKMFDGRIDVWTEYDLVVFCQFGGFYDHPPPLKKDELCYQEIICSKGHYDRKTRI